MVAAAAGVTVGELLPDRVQDVIPRADVLALHERSGVFEGLTDSLSARHLAHPGAARAVVQQDDVAGEIRTMRAAQIEQHAVMAGNGDDLDTGDFGGVGMAHLAGPRRDVPMAISSYQTSKPTGGAPQTRAPKPNS